MIDIAGHHIGEGQPCFIIAEAGVNHNGNLDNALRLVDAAADAGASVVKFQTFRPEKLVSVNAAKADYQIQATGSTETQHEMLAGLTLSEQDHHTIQRYCAQKGVLFMSTPFDPDSADLLDQMGVPAFKIGSGELTNLPFLRHVASKKKPIIFSTGMAYLGEVEQAVQTFYQAEHRDIVVLHCVSNYPALPQDINLRAMHTLKTAFQIPVGYSDHTLGIDIALAAVALGACVIEKHLTLDRTMIGPDHTASLEPSEFKVMVEGIRRIESALGNGRKQPAQSEENVTAVARRSLVAASDLPAGTVISEDMIAFKRPGTGLPPSMLSYIVGRVTRDFIAADSLLSLEMFA